MAKSIFDFVKQINKHKHNDDGFDDYNQFVINKNFSFFADTIFHAQTMNISFGLKDEEHFAYMFNSIRPKSRFSKWFKKEEASDIELLREMYGLSEKKSKEALQILDEKQLEVLRHERAAQK